MTSDLTECLAKAKNVADANLNSVYKHVLAKLGASDGERLRKVQRWWIQYRDGECLAEKELYDGGTAANPAYLACIEAMTRARTRELQVTYKVRIK